jgi:thioesterase domain-containing protein
MDPAGRLMPAGAVGEVVIRGNNVTAGYENNPQANEAAFAEGWFRTGDQGRMDEDGYLTLTGRLKELINRGGEKISPREIDDVLLSHPAVAQAMAFAMPHPTLGEEVAAAVVLQPGRSATQAEVQQHAARELAPFKVPQRVVFVSEIPKGPTGKPQRIGMAEKLEQAQAAVRSKSSGAVDEPLGDTERKLAEIWARLLDRRDFGRTQNFFECGGNSLLAAQMVKLVERTCGVALPIRALFDSGTIAGLARVIDALPPAPPDGIRRFVSLVPFQPVGTKPPLFMVHGHSGRSVGLGLFATCLDTDQPYYGFVARGMDGRRLPHWDFADMAVDYLRELREVQPQGPYYLGAVCSGGMIAYEMAQQLFAAGQPVALLALLDTAHPSLYGLPGRGPQAARTTKLLMRRLLFRLLLACGHRAPVRLGERIVNETIRRRAATYPAQPYPGKLTIIRSEVHHRSPDPHLGWTGWAKGGVDLHRVPGDHSYLFTRRNAELAAQQLRICLREAQATALGEVRTEVVANVA